MFKKKQVLVFAVISIACFLIGTMVSVTAKDGGGNPWDKVWTTISGLESRVETLEEQALLPQGVITAPAYDSGWLTISQAQQLTITHNLNTEEIFVYLWGKHEAGYIHQYTNGENGVSVAWIEANKTVVWRHTYDAMWYQVRVMIWKISES